MRKILISVFVFCIFLLSVPVYFFLIQKNEPTPPASIASKDTPAVACVLPLQAKVLQIEYYPLSASDPQFLDSNETGLDTTVAAQEIYVNNLSSELLGLVGEATKFHGYKNPSAPQFLNYSVINTKKYYEKIPRGYLLKPNEGVYRPNYAQIMQKENICDYVDNKGVTEVWMFGYHHGAIEPDESRMASKLGDYSNSGPKEEELPQNLRMPVCKKPYVLYNFNYTRTALEMFHNRIHQLENILPRAERKYPPNAQNTARGASLFWGNFSEYIQPDTVRNYNSACGNAHFTPNWTNASQDYKYSLQNSRLNNCETWNPDSTKSTYVNANCSQWGCSEKGFYMWYQQNLPGYNNGITFNRGKVNNWWEAMYDPVAYLEKGGLTGDSIYNNCTLSSVATPTLFPTPTMTPVPTISPKVPTATGIKSPTLTPTQVSVKTPTPVKTSTPTKTPTAMVVLTNPPTFTPAPQPTNIASCDPDGSGGITFADLRLARRELAGLENSDKSKCMTGGQRTSLQDIRKIRRILAGLENP